MSEDIFEYREEFNITDIARKYAERVGYVIDEQALANVEHQLAEYGYIKVVRCRDCKHHHGRMCMFPDGVGDFKRWYVEDDDYCSDSEKIGARNGER